MVKITEIASKADLDAYTVSVPRSTVLVIYYHDSEGASCGTGAAVVLKVAAEYESDSRSELLSVAIVDVDREKPAGPKSKKYGIPTLPYLLIISRGKASQAMGNFDAPKLRNAISDQLAAAVAPKPVEPPSGMIRTNEFNGEPLPDRLAKLTRYAAIVLFMKGTPVAPACRFSRKMVKLLDDNGVKYASYNILMDENVRQGLKDFGNWPTYPQLWVEGKVAGGLDVIRDELSADPRFLISSSLARKPEIVQV